MNLRLILIILFSTVNPVDLLDGTSETLAEAVLGLWKDCNLASYAPPGTRSALIQASGYTKTAGKPVDITKWQVDLETGETVTEIWTNDAYFKDASFVLWDSVGVQHTIQFYDPDIRPSWYYYTLFDLPNEFLGIPQWKFILFKDLLDFVTNNGMGIRKQTYNLTFPMGRTPLLDAHYSYSALTDTVYIFNQADCMEIKAYSTLKKPYDYAKPCDPSSGGFVQPSRSTEFHWLAYLTKSCRFEKFRVLDTYPMAYVNFSNDRVWSTKSPWPTTLFSSTSSTFSTSSSTSIAPLTAPSPQTTTTSNETSDIGAPVDDSEGFGLYDPKDGEPGSLAAVVIGPIVAVIFLCLLLVFGVFVLTLRHKRKKKKLGSTLASKSRLARFRGMRKKTTESQSRTGENEEVDMSGPHDSDLTTGKPKTSTKCSSTPLITHASTKPTQQTTKGTPSMVPQDSKDRRLRKYRPSGSRSHGSPADVDGTSTSKNKTASKNTKNKLTGPIPSMVPYDSRHFRKNLPSHSRSHGSPADVNGTSTFKNKTTTKNIKNKLTGPLPSMVPQDSKARDLRKKVPSASRVP